MTDPNIGLQYYKLYYEDARIRWSQESEQDKKQNQRVFKEKNDRIFCATLPPVKNIWAYSDQLARIDLTTTYPGLLLGSGLSHGSGLLGELKLGFFFDYTTGLPVIPGSSVKGVLRSTFPQFYLKDFPDKAKQLTQLIQYYLKEITEKEWTATAIDELETFIFGTPDPGKGETNKARPGTLIFHDALPVDASRVPTNGKYENKFLGDDYITPHKQPLKNPVPIGFLKVLPGVVIRFQFALKEFKTKDEVFVLDTENQKILFTKILEDFGVGAKTNVGYGQLITPKIWDEIYSKSSNNQQRNKSGQTNKKKTHPLDDYHHTGIVSANQVLTGMVVSGSKKNPDKNRILLFVNDQKFYFTNDEISDYKIGTLLKVSVKPTLTLNGVAQIIAINS